MRCEYRSLDKLLSEKRRYEIVCGLILIIKKYRFIEEKERYIKLWLILYLFRMVVFLF